jgi:hypothetical protein
VTIHLTTTGFASPTELVAYFFEAGAELSDQYIWRAPDGTWWGSAVVKVKPNRARPA